MTSLSLRLLALVSVVTVIDHFLLFFRLTKANPLNILAKFFANLVGARTNCIAFSRMIASCSLIFGKEGRRRLLPDLSERCVSLIPVIPVVDYFLLFLGLAETKTFARLSNAIIPLIGSWTQISSLWPLLSIIESRILAYQGGLGVSLGNRSHCLVCLGIRLFLSHRLLHLELCGRPLR